jgi:cobalt-zinc-cadmium efflux system outer membrane protein
VTVKLRAQVSTADFRAKREQLLHDLHRTKLALANLWGEPSEVFEIDAASLQAEPVAHAAAAPASSPDVRERELAAERALRKLELEQSNASSDVSVGIGVRRFENGGDIAGLLSLSVPITVFDDNQGNVDRAAADYRAARLDVEEAQKQHRQQMLALDEEVERSRTELESVRDVQLPLASEALAAARRGYKQGAFAFTEIAEAQRIVAELEDRQISALRTLHLALASIEKLTGTTHATVSQSGQMP